MLVRSVHRSRGRRILQALALSAAFGAQGPASAQVPVFVRSYSVVPTSVIVPAPPVLVTTSLPVVVSSGEFLIDPLPVSITPTSFWIPGVSYVTTSQWLPVVSPCGSTIVDMPSTVSVVESPIRSTPQTRPVDELPIESESSQPKPDAAGRSPEKDATEPDLKQNAASPPGMPETPGEPDLKPAPSAAKADETKPEKPAAEASKLDDIPPNPPNSPPAGAAPAEKASAAPAEKPPAAAAEPGSIPLPEDEATKSGSPATKSAAPVEPPPAPPAEESKPGTLAAPGTPNIPLPEVPVPDLEPVNSGDPKKPVTPTSAVGQGSEASKSGTSPATGSSARPSGSESVKELPEIPPPVDDMPPAGKPGNESVRPVTPLPELPLPEDLPPAVESRNDSVKPLDPQAVKAGDTKLDGSESQRREARRPVIETPKPASASGLLEILVREARSGSPDGGVTVRFRQTGTSERIEARSAVDGRAQVTLPAGTWEVEVESVGGQRFVLGDVVSKNSRVTTASGRDLPRLEINR